MPEIIEGRMGKYFPEYVINFVNTYQSKVYNNDNYENNKFNNFYLSSWLEVENSNFSFYSYWNADVNPVGYIFPAASMILLSFFSKVVPNVIVSPFNLLLFARIINLLIYTVLIYLSIKYSPHYKLSIFTLALLPMSLFLASSISYDMITISFSLLFFSLFSNIYFSSRNITILDLLIFAFIGFFLGSTKTVYSSIFILLLLIDSKRFENLKKYIFSIVLIILMIIVPFLLHRTLLNNILDTNQIWEWSVIQSSQTEFLLNNLFGFWSIIFNSFSNFGDYYLQSFFVSLGNLDTNLNNIVYLLLVLDFILILSTELVSLKIKIPFVHRIIILFSITISIYLIFAGTYIIWTGVNNPLGTNYVDGVQGRYFIPLVIFVLLLFSNNVLYRHISKFRFKLESFQVLFVILVLSNTLVTIFIRYWL